MAKGHGQKAQKKTQRRKKKREIRKNQAKKERAQEQEKLRLDNDKLRAELERNSTVVRERRDNEREQMKKVVNMASVKRTSHPSKSAAGLFQEQMNLTAKEASDDAPPD